MKHTSLVAIFAHPDDEAFGPGGTIALYAKTHDITVICATRGEEGKNHSGNTDKNIASIREQELHESARILGVNRVIFLDYQDGTLCNNVYHELADKIQKIIDPIRPEILLTFENKGVSGHLDHVAISMITHFIFHRTPYTKTLMSYCMSDEIRRELKSYFIYVPQGYRPDQIDRIIDVSSVWDQKIAAIKAHVSQTKDGSRILSRLEQNPMEEYFLIHEKDQCADIT